MKYNSFSGFLTHSPCDSQLQKLESVHHPIALKSSLSGGFLESMCLMDCALFVKAVASPLSGSAFVQVTPTDSVLLLTRCVLRMVETPSVPLRYPLDADRLQNG